MERSVVDEIMKTLATYVNKYKRTKLWLYERRHQLNFWEKCVLSFFVACLTALGAQVCIFLPFTPVPITLQVFFVLMSGVLLGKGFSGVSQVMYLGMGLLGLPVFTGWNSGISVLLGVTGGYLLGFIVASSVIGWAMETKLHRSVISLFLIMVLGMTIIYVFGALQLALILHTGLQRTLALGVLPFIPGDIMKAVSVTILGKLMLPAQTQMNGSSENDST